MSASATALVSSQVFPIVEGTPDLNGDVRYEALVGTGFCVSDSGWCLSCWHVFEDSSRPLYAMFPDGLGWRGCDITAIDHHPTEDLSIFRVSARNLGQFVPWVPGLCHAGRDYTAFGYPAQLLKDHGQRSGEHLIVLDRPDLIVSKGHLRRRYTYSLPGFRGTHFADMSDWLGEGSSGGPVVGGAPSTLIGVYLGFRRESLPDADGIPRLIGARGILLVIDTCLDWKPRVTGALSLHDLLSGANPGPPPAHITGLGIAEDASPTILSDFGSEPRL